MRLALLRFTPPTRQLTRERWLGRGSLAREPRAQRRAHLQAPRRSQAHLPTVFRHQNTARSRLPPELLRSALLLAQH